MCSGCSGDYAGGFDDCGEPAPDLDGHVRPAMNFAEPHRGRGTLRSTRKARAFEAGANSKWYPREERISRPGEQSAADFYEILVSGTRIVEIRLIQADGGEIKELAEMEAAEGPAARRHFTVESAKYYRTRPMDEESAGVRRKTLRSRWSDVAAGEFRRWLRWARKAL